jgi:hypothetical protein
MPMVEPFDGVTSTQFNGLGGAAHLVNAYYGQKDAMVKVLVPDMV